jgi:hypothetical protein
MANTPNSAPLESNGSTLRVLLRDIRDNKIDDQDKRILTLYAQSLVQKTLADKSAAGPTKIQAVFHAIDELWLKRNRPKSLSEDLVNEWLKFIYPEYLYFYPVRHNTFASPSIVQASIDLCNPAVVAHIIAEGNEQETERLQSNETSQFFVDSLASEVSLDRTAAKSEKKIDTRVKRLFDDLATFIQPDMPQADDRPKVIEVVELIGNPVALESTTVYPAAPPVTTTISLPTPSALPDYQDVLDRFYPPSVVYFPVVCRYEKHGVSAELPGDVTARLFLEQEKTLVIIGTTGTGKTTYLTQVFVPVARQMNLVPVFVSLPDYFDHQSHVGDLAGFVREKIFGHWHPDSTEKEQFARELAQALRERRVAWLLDGYDELTPAHRLEAVRELASLERFVVTTRAIRPIPGLKVNAQAHLLRVELPDTHEDADALLPMQLRVQIEDWFDSDADNRQTLQSGLMLSEAVKLAENPIGGLHLAGILDPAIAHQMATHARFHNASSIDLVKLNRTT